MIKLIFSVKNIKPGEPKMYRFFTNSKVTINDFQLKKDQVSRVEISKLKDIPHTIFVTLYNNNGEIGTVVSHESYVLDLEIVDGVKHYELRPLRVGDTK
jgi:hypothetical protein